MISNNNKDLNTHVTKRNKNVKLIPFDNGDAYNPFANFNCNECDEKFTKNLQGALYTSCRSTFHLKCLNETEIEDVQNHKFVCQYCIQDQIRHKNLNEDKNKLKPFISSTPKPVHVKLNKKSQKNNKYLGSDSSSDISLSSCDLSDTTDSDLDTKLIEKYRKLRKLMTKHNNAKKKKESKCFFSDTDENEEDSKEVAQSEAMLGIYRLTKEDRDKTKYEKLPIVDNVDTKWSVFYGLFKESRKLFSDSEHILRIQKSIKSKEILEIGGISLLDPRNYWQSI